MNGSLTHRLLRLSSAGLPLVVPGRALKQHVGQELDRALRRRVLVELPRLDVWPPCTDCDQECEGRLIQERDHGLVAACPYDSSSDEKLSEDDVRQFELDADELCLAVRQDSGLGGNGPSEIADGIWLIGQTGEEKPTSRCIFLAFQTASVSAVAIVAILKRVAGSKPVTLLFAGDAHLDLRLALEDAGIAVAPIISLLIRSDVPFRLDPVRLASAHPRPRLTLRRSDRSVSFGEATITLSRQNFKLLVFLVTKSQEGRRLVDNRDIEEELWGTAAHGRQVADAVRRLRNALAPVLGGREKAEQFIQNSPGTYAINEDFAVLEVI